MSARPAFGLRSSFVAVAFVTASLGAACHGAKDTKKYPQHEISIVLPAAPGDSLDLTGRIFSDELGKSLGVATVPLNRQGGSGVVGADSVAKAAADGYTVALVPGPAITTAGLIENAPYDPMTAFTSLGLVGRSPLVLAVKKDAPWKTLAELVAHSKANAGKVRIGTFGPGSMGHFAIGIINGASTAGLTPVPFKGAAPAIAATLGGHVEGTTTAYSAVRGQLQSGDLRALVASSKIPELKDVPTLQETGIAADPMPETWFAFFAPAKTPAEVTTVLVDAIAKTAKSPAVMDKMKAAGIVPTYETPDATMTAAKAERTRFERLSKDVGVAKP